MIPKGEVICKIERLLEEYEKVLLVLDQEYLNLLQEDKKDRKGIIILSKLEPLEEHAFDFLQISEEECGNLIKIYQMYEFSDHFKIITQNNGFGTLKNYVTTGVLTMDEAAEALFM